MSWDEGIAALEALAVRVAPAALAAVTAAQTPVFEASQEIVPVGPSHHLSVPEGNLKASGLQQQEIDGTTIRGRISYGNETTLSGWGGAEAQGAYGPRHHRAAGPVWADVGVEIFVHEGTVHHAARKFLEGPLLEQMGELEPRMATAFAEALGG